MRQIYLDIYTTGLSASCGDRIIELGLVELVNGQLSERRFHSYFMPDRPSHPDALAVHGLTDEFLSDKPTFKSTAGELQCLLQDADLYIHNAPFDLEFLDAEFYRAGLPSVSMIVGSHNDICSG